MRGFRHFLLAATLLSASSGAMAADLLSTRKGPPPMMMPPVMTWTGFYVGGQVGYSSGVDTTKEFLTATMGYVGLKNRFDPDGFVGGAHVGANYQFGAFVAGIEGDIEFGKVKGGFTDPPVAPFNPGGRGQTEIDTQGSLRLRLGYAVGPALFYATGGLAVADIKSTYWNWPGTSESFSKTATGYTIGGGIEYAFTQSLSARVEYRFTQFERIQNDSQQAFPGFSGTQEPRYHTGRAGVSYRF
ncbi:MAG: porin family protein [Hyphomicrobiales bacterium]|nr:MAG: porin family protein [Hyphomicrobiales bacterium]